MLNFARKRVAIDHIKKKRIDQAIVELVVIENKPFQLVEKHNFRKLIHACEPAYICPSHTTLRRQFDQFAKKTKDDFKKELFQDLKDVEDKVVNLTSDHGTSHDRFRSHKNVVTVSRCTKDFVIKTDTVAVIQCDGSQSGEVIRQDVKNELDKAGRTDEWIINWTTDGEAKQVNARAPGKHRGVGMETNHTGRYS
jgi:hypothetical protein